MAVSDVRDTPRHTWFGSRVEALLPQLMGTALRLAGSRDEAEDLVAEALAKGWERLDSLEDPDALGAWLCRILTNVFISQRRTGPAEHEVQPYEERAESETTFSIFERLHQPFLLWQSNPERDFLRRLLRDDLERAVDGLPDAFRPAVVLVDLQGLSYHEAAESLSVPVGTVRSRLARGRSLLQEALWTQAVDAGYRKEGLPVTGSDTEPKGTPDD